MAVEQSSGTQAPADNSVKDPGVQTTQAPSTQTTSAPAPKGLSTTTPPADTTQAPGTQTTQAGTKTEEQKSADAQSGNAADDLALKFPEGEDVDAAFVTEFKAQCKAAGMTSKQAQAMVDLQFKRVNNYREAVKNFDAKNLETLKADPEFGGAKYVENMEVAKKGIVEFGSPELVHRLKMMGLENDPHIVKHFAKLGKASSEGNTPRVPGGNLDDPGAALQNHLDLRYPSMKKNK